MKSLFTLLVLLAFGFYSSIAQTIVSTDPENKNVVLEEYTGINCPNCPAGHAIAQAIYDAHPDDVVLINIHEGFFATPNAGQPDFRTPWGSAIAGQAGSSSIGWPSGSVNRHLFSGNNTAMSRSSWSWASNQILDQSSYLNIAAEATIVTSTRQLVVYVEAYYTADSPFETNLLNVAILQNNIIGYQSGGGSNYTHMHMLRHLLTDQWGVEISETTEGSFYSGTFTYELPLDYNDIEVVLEDLDVVAFVSETHQEVVSGSMAEITMVESNEYDAAIYTAYVPQTACTGELTPAVLLKNYGTIDLTSLDFEYSANDGETYTYNWTGDLQQNETELVTLPAIVYPVTDDNEFNINCEMPNGQSDQLPQNDIYISDNPGSITFPTECYFLLLADDNPEDISWNIVDTEGMVIAEGGPYETTGVKVTDFSFPESGCFTLTLNDASGQGLSGGFYVISDENTNILWTGKPFTDLAVTELAHDITISIPESFNDESINVYPNPATDKLYIEFYLSKEDNVEIRITDLVGRTVLVNNPGMLSEGTQHFNLRTGELKTGIYLVQLKVGNESYSTKVSIK